MLVGLLNKKTRVKNWSRLIGELEFNKQGFFVLQSGLEGFLLFPTGTDAIKKFTPSLGIPYLGV